MKKVFQSAAIGKDIFGESVKMIFNNKEFLDVIKLALEAPDYMLPIITPIVELNVSQKETFTKEEILFFSSHLEKDLFNHCPQAKQKIEHKLLDAAIDSVKLGNFRDVKSVKRILLALAKNSPEMKIPFLTCPEIVDLKKAVASLPQQFFQNLHAALNQPGVSVYDTLKPYCEGETKIIARQLKNHYKQLDKLIRRIRNRQIPLNEFPVLEVR
jgi:hypothetical protein